MEMKKAIALVVLALTFGLPTLTNTTSIALADGMAYRERQDNGNTISKDEFDRYEARWKNLSKEQKRRYTSILMQTQEGKNELNEEFHGRRPHGYWMDRYNLGSSNGDGDGMAWRERQDNNNDIKHDRRPRTASNNDENGMDAFNRTHGR